jgi:S1-C subfamily serine protease
MLAQLLEAKPDLYLVDIQLAHQKMAGLKHSYSLHSILRKFCPSGFKKDEIALDFFMGPTPQEGTGSGFVVDQQGHIITNNHVIEKADSIEITFSDETKVPATVIGTDPHSDLAVLKPESLPAGLTPVELGTSAGHQVGQRAIAIGNPFDLQQTLTS